MTSKIRNSVRSLGRLPLLALACAIALTSIQNASADQLDGRERSDSHARKLEGTWFTQVTARDCQSGMVLRTFPAFNTYAHGGTLIDTTAAVSPALRSPGHGVWEKTGRRTFRALSIALLFSPAGVWTGTQTITQAIEIGADPDESTSDASVQILDTNGNLLNTICATAVAQRVE